MTELTLGGVGLLIAGTTLALNVRTVRIALFALILGAGALSAAAVAILADGTSIGAHFSNGLSPSLGLDGLSAFFVLVVCVTTVPALLAARDALRGDRLARPLTALSGAFVIALVGVLAARDVVTFLGFWELMTLVPAAAILVARRDEYVRHAVFVYLAITHLGGAGVWVAMLALAHNGALDGSLAATGPKAVIAVAAIIGFGTKAGLMPMHSWLPRAHPVAPSHISALMSGVMIKVALYGLIRVLFQWLDPVPLWVGMTVLALGLLSSLGGVLYALMQHELKRLLAFHSIENVGIIALGLGAAIVLDRADNPTWAAIAFGAAMLHTANHAAFKSLLFLGAGSFGRAVGNLELDGLGGLLGRMPWTGWSFLVGCAAIAGLPPLNGFVSEWLTLQALLHVGLDGHVGISLAGALATAGLAATAALASYCFVKVVGLVLLGAPRSEAAGAACESPAFTKAAVASLAAACGALALLSGLVFPTLAALDPSSSVELAGGIDFNLPGTGGLRPVGLAVALLVISGGVWRVTNRARRAAPSPAWACGQRVEPELAWTGAGFTKPLSLVMESVLRPRRESKLRMSGPLVTEVVYHAEVPHLFDTLLYRPVRRAALRVAAVARRLQSGSLRLYLWYLLAMFLAVLALARLGGLQ